MEQPRSGALRRAFEGTGPFPAIALALALLGTILLIVTLNSIGGLVWTGTAVHGTEQQGIVLYRYHGVNYSIDDAGSSRTGPRTVYVDPHDPSRAVLNTRASGWLQNATVGVPYVLAAAFALESVRRKVGYRRRRRLLSTSPDRDTFGYGLDPETVNRLRARQHTDAQGRAQRG
jgi:hypothetical protein